ncbi:GntR family transcriptional regulator [Sagittula sp. M10.9X]|uniref:GntR family transcriptional regulator n=1 Tax=Sagittula salina TaxID=2820268 RepID=A0A940S3X1_9RHOB|nr:GntR family transcriptional regulator [Sagittula salina]
MGRASRNGILDGALQTDKTLSEQTVRQMLGVSRGLVRGAAWALRREELVMPARVAESNTTKTNRTEG